MALGQDCAAGEFQQLAACRKARRNQSVTLIYMWVYVYVCMYILQYAYLKE